MYTMSDNFSCLYSSSWSWLSLNTFSLQWLQCLVCPLEYCPPHPADTSQPNPHRNTVELLNYVIYAPTIWKCKDTFPKNLNCYFVYASLSDVFLPGSCLLSSVRLSEPITAKPRSPLVFWFVELAQSLLRSFLFPVESLTGSVNCKMIGYCPSHENIMVYLLV